MRRLVNLRLPRASEQRARWMMMATLIVLPAAILASLVVLIVAVQRQDELQAQVRRSQEIHRDFRNLQALLIDVETGQRGFIATGDELFLQPTHAAMARLPGAERDLQAALRGDKDSSSDLEALTRLISRKLALSSAAIAAHRLGEPLVTTEARERSGKAVMDEVRAVTDRAEQRQDGQIENGLQKLHRLAHGIQALFLVAFPLLVGLLFTAAAFGRGYQKNIRRITELAKAEKRSAEAANIAKSAFLATMSHDLRTPMNGVLGMAHMLARSSLTAEQHDQVEVIKSSADNLLVLLNDILDLSKIEAGKIVLEAGDFDLHALLNRKLKLHGGPAGEKGVELKLEVGDNVTQFVHGDQTRLRQILSNLLSNAVKFTDAGVIELKVMKDAERLVFRVTDTGCGVPDGARARLFSPFEQADETTTRRFGGTGLGLTISRQLARLMGGDLVLESSTSTGSTFRLDLTLPEAEPIVDEATPEPVEVGELRVLVADDNPQNRAVCAAFLAVVSAQVVMAADGMEAVAAVEEGDFDLILMDVHMPRMDGLQALEEIRRRDLAPRIPIVAVTADAMSGDRERYLAAGFDGHLAKPMRPDEFMAVLAWANDFGQQAAAAHAA